SDLWVQKMKTYFNRIDFDKDGAITRMDFESMAERFAKESEMKAEHAKVLMDSLTGVWDNFLTAVAGGKGIDETTFINSMKEMVKNPEAKSVVEGPLPLFFRAVDTNEDNNISRDEYGIFFGMLGLDKTMAPASFDAIDTNNDGLLSLEEFVIAGSDFFMNDGDSTNKVFWGPLV
uniref:Sarcoplasmic calcium-binding protein n=1 Tax=Hediste diversicolor TaxID=126592 RepID=SCP_HEDDI|nr:RecName: Full=Sarcoplasmic calcium-binding protein; Short=SCP [Hediste diversicolor]1Q80_A Chain A, Sarcoplasmic calcium-binding protein [Hediste diversicolor]2SCP_A Chain A, SARCOPLASMIC CALCIUM-BINDING PROTEIN [Hediste diversicolor]2SCP_B Chain B, SARCOPLASMIC CALCIUM-BINDING PROTEIN [Hediste diversicolor]